MNLHAYMRSRTMSEKAVLCGTAGEDDGGTG